MSTIPVHATHAIHALAGPLSAAPTITSGSRSTVVLTIMLIMVMLTMRLVARAVKPVIEVIRAAVAVVGAALLLTGLGVLLIVMLVT